MVALFTIGLLLMALCMITIIFFKSKVMIGAAVVMFIIGMIFMVISTSALKMAP